MGMVRSGLRWGLSSAQVAILVIASMQLTGTLSPTYQWFVRYFPPEVWAALAAWVAVAVGIVTVVVAGRYAKQQVDKAQEQIREAREARLDQERQAREAIETQVRIAEEQAQPNVVLYTEMNPSAKRFVEIVLKNFGATPAYKVKTLFEPPLKATPNLLSKGKLADVPIPEFPILAPGQEWRTGWDFSVSRKRHQKKWAPLAGKTETDLSDKEKFSIQAHMSYTGEKYEYEQVIADMILPSVHSATVSYQDSRGKTFETNATLDSELFTGTTWVDIKTVHDLVKTLDARLEEQNKGLEAVHNRLAEFGTEHDGIWIYTSSDDEERQFRRLIANAKRREERERSDHMSWMLSGQEGDDPLRGPNADSVIQIAIKETEIGDWYIPKQDGSLVFGNAFRIAFIKQHVYEDFDDVYELFDSDGESIIREFQGTQVNVVRGGG